MSNRMPSQVLAPIAALCLLTSGPALADGENSGGKGKDEVDAALVDNLQSQQEAREEAISQGVPGLSPEDIRTLRKLVNEREAARNNPTPPSINNKVTMLERGEAPTLKIMERFDTTVMFTDRNGEPLEITTWRINDKEAADLVPIHKQKAATPQPRSNEEPQAEADLENYEGDDDGQSGTEGAVKALIVTPVSAMRSTNLTVMLKGQSHPISVTVSTLSSMNSKAEVAYLQEMRLSWVSTMNPAQAAAGNFAGANGDTSLSGALISLVQGVPTDNMVKVELKGSLANQVSLWHDQVEDLWYLRMAEHIEPWNVAIANRTNDGLRGYSVAELKGEPPRLLDMSANGRFSTLTLKQGG